MTGIIIFFRIWPNSLIYVEREAIRKKFSEQNSSLGIRREATKKTKSAVLTAPINFYSNSLAAATMSLGVSL
jgi:hypothetical protein